MSIATPVLIPFRRARDGEVAGYLRPVGGSEQVEPVTLLGHTLAAPTSRQEAEDLLEERGLTVLSEPWWVLAPADLAPSLDLRQSGVDWTWQRFVIVELNRDVVRIRPLYAPPGGASVTVSLPAADVLHATPPGS